MYVVYTIIAIIVLPMVLSNQYLFLLTFAIQHLIIVLLATTNVHTRSLLYIRCGQSYLEGCILTDSGAVINHVRKLQNKKFKEQI